MREPDSCQDREELLERLQLVTETLIMEATGRRIHGRRNVHLGREDHTSAVRGVLRIWPICSL